MYYYYEYHHYHYHPRHALHPWPHSDEAYRGLT